MSADNRGRNFPNGYREGGVCGTDYRTNSDALKPLNKRLIIPWSLVRIQPGPQYKHQETAYPYHAWSEDPDGKGRGLARARFAADDDHRVCRHRRRASG